METVSRTVRARNSEILVFLAVPITFLLACFYSPTGVQSSSETDDASTTDFPTTGSVQPFCGDGIRDPGEACDDGNKGNTDQCLNDCTEAYCGDAFIQSGLEFCDDGDGANNDKHAFASHCNTTCDGLAPHCGDTLCEVDLEHANSCPQDCLPICGNGITEEGEQCDDGIGGVPAFSPNCDDDCTMVICGDGVPNEEAGEACDDSNDDETDACPQCQPAKCGDGFLHISVEECDNGSRGSGVCYDCILPRRVFVTSNSYTGSLGGLDGADSKCQTHARAAGLNGTFRAWLSSQDGSPVSRFDTSFTGAYALLDDTVVAVGWPDLTSGSLKHAIDMDENGMPLIDDFVWTNAKFDGTVESLQNCQNWQTSDMPHHSYCGLSSAENSVWTQFLDLGCHVQARLYCFEV